MGVAVIGDSHVGLPVAAGFAEAGSRVVCRERDPSRPRLLWEGRAPFSEPGLDVLASDGLRKGTLTFAKNARQAVGRTELCLVAVGTAANDHAPLMETAALIAQGMSDGSAIALKSTLQPTTADSGAVTIGDRVKVAVNPEFLSVVYNRHTGGGAPRPQRRVSITPGEESPPAQPRKTPAEAPQGERMETRARTVNPPAEEGK